MNKLFSFTTGLLVQRELPLSTIPVFASIPGGGNFIFIPTP